MKRLLPGAVLVFVGAAVCAQTPEGEERPFFMTTTSVLHDEVPRDGRD